MTYSIRRCLHHISAALRLRRTSSESTRLGSFTSMTACDRAALRRSGRSLPVNYENHICRAKERDVKTRLSGNRASHQWIVSVTRGSGLRSFDFHVLGL